MTKSCKTVNTNQETVDKGKVKIVCTVHSHIAQCDASRRISHPHGCLKDTVCPAYVVKYVKQMSFLQLNGGKYMD